ncbi:outer membrane beta-barrel protein [Psychroserpens jangbogonensis]|uniref:outer membrane beta-barrel protein n=1 Tax=Psychroserpens jangbogonensis TaxID=1484460 RepID=UPI00053E64F8|nr:outer membrane beta-barrel protein [Psychroserpens jangbogonensis]
MKNVVNTVLAIVLMSTIAYSQTIKITGGVNLMQVKFKVDGEIDPPTDGDPTDPVVTRNAFSDEALSSSSKTIESTSNETGFYLGLALSDISLSESLELLPEVRFVVVKDFNQIQMPVLLKYNIVDNLSAVAGPNFGFLLDPSQNTKAFNLAIDFGLSYNISDKFSLEGRYDWGLTNLLEDGDSDNYIKINNIQFGVAYNFGK